MKIIILNLFLIFMLSLFSGCAKPVRVLLVTGGHAYDTTQFYDMFGSLEGVSFDSVSFPAAKGKLMAETIDAYDVLVFYDFIPDRPRQDSAIYLNLSRQGKPMLFLHHSLCSFQEWNGYMQMVGGKYVMPGYSSDTTLLSGYKHGIDLPVTIIDSDHPVTRGIENFEIHDEGYSNITVLDRVTPLLTTDHHECSPLVGWTNTYGHSDIVYLIFGHDQYAYKNEPFRQILSNAIAWLAHSD